MDDLAAGARTRVYDSMIRVLHLIVSLDRGGAELALRELVREPTEDIHQMVCTIKPGGSLMPAFGGRVVSLNVSQSLDLRALPRLLWLIRSLRPTFLHTWMFHANVLGRIAGALSGLPVVSAVRSMELDKPRWRVAMDRATSRWATYTIAVSEAARKVAVRRDGAAPERTCVIPNGVDLPHPPAVLAGFANGRIRVGAAGRLEPVKDHASLIRAFAGFAGSYPEATLEIVGQGSQRELLSQLAANLGIASRLLLPGEIQDAHQRMPNWDIFVQPSLAEGMPRALLEAMAAGLPVVATTAGGIPEALGTTGRLVSIGNVPALSRALYELARDPVTARGLGAAARQRVKTCFSRERFVDQHLALYYRLTAGSGSLTLLN